jgi:hypothetical protein
LTECEGLNGQAAVPESQGILEGNGNVQVEPETVPVDTRGEESRDALIIMAYDSLTRGQFYLKCAGSDVLIGRVNGGDPFALSDEVLWSLVGKLEGAGVRP